MAAAKKNHDKTTKVKPVMGPDTGKPYSADNQPPPEAKKAGWEAKRAQRLLTQKILEVMLKGKTLDEYVKSLVINACSGNAKAIETINNGIEEQVAKTETKVTYPSIIDL